MPDGEERLPSYCQTSPATELIKGRIKGCSRVRLSVAEHPQLPFSNLPAASWTSAAVHDCSACSSATQYMASRHRLVQQVCRAAWTVTSADRLHPTLSPM